ncbi:MAG: hypothetical protein ACFCU8_09495 [Thermosynechococcaceae cyanobacterium]
MLKLSNLPVLTLLAVPFLSLPVVAQGFDPLPSPTGAPPPASSSSPAKPAESPYFRSRAKNLARQAAERANGGLSQYRAEPTMSGPALTAPFVENSNGSLTFTFKGGTPGSGALTTETVATVYPNGAVQLTYNGPVRGSNIGGAQLDPPAANPPANSGWIPAPSPQPSAAPAPSVPAPPVQTAPAPAAPLAPSRQGLPTLSPQSTRPQPVTIQPFEQPLPTPSVTPSLPSPAIATAPATAPSLPRSSDQALAADLFLARAKNLARQTAIQTNGGLSQYRPDPLMFGPASQAPHTKNADGSITFKFRGGVPEAQRQSFESEITVAQNNTVTINYNGPIRQ